MVVHAAFGGSTNLLLHIPAIAFAAGLRRPTVDDWHEVNVKVPRLVERPAQRPVLPSDRPRLPRRAACPRSCSTCASWACSTCRSCTVTGEPLERVLAWWEASERRQRCASGCHEQDGVDPDDVIMSPARARERGLTSTVTFPRGQPRPGGLGHQEHGHRPERRRCRRRLSQDRPGAGLHPRARRHRRDQGAGRPADPARRRPGPDRPRTDGGRHGGDLPDHLGAPLPLVRQAGRRPDRRPVLGRVDRRLHRPRQPRGPGRRADRPAPRRRPHPDRRRSRQARGIARPGRCRGRRVRARGRPRACSLARSAHPRLSPDPDLPDDTRLWAALQAVGGGTWGGCVYDTDAIIAALPEGRDVDRRDPR